MRGIFGVAPGADFASSLRDALRTHLEEQGPQAMARVRIFTNTQRAARRLAQVFADGPATLLPKIEVFTDLARDPRLLDAPILEDTALNRQLQVMQLVRQLIATQPEIAQPAHGFELAKALTELMDELRSDGVPLDALMALEGNELNEYWAVTLEFLKAIRSFWEADSGDAPASIEAASFAAIEALGAQWAISSPTDPIIFAGSTGSRGISRALMKVVLAQPNGAVVLPGFDFTLEAETWAALSDPKSASNDHPQAVFARLISALSAMPSDVQMMGPETTTPRQQLVSLALRPAPVTDLWMAQGDVIAKDASEATDGLSLMLAQNQTEEALAIAIALRKAVEDGRQAILITPEATLSRRVSAQLQRWEITPDDSAGRPLGATPPAIFLDLVARFDGASDLPGLASILKHPLCATGADRVAHIRMVRSFDHEVMRDVGPQLNWEKASNWTAIDPAQREARESWLDWLQSGIELIDGLHAEATLSLHCEGLISALIHFSAGPGATSAPDLWDKDAGQDCLETLETLARVSDAGGDLPFRDFLSILQSQIAGKKDRAVFETDPRVLIWGTLEARVQTGDLVILAGLNEDTWPKPLRPDPWLNRSLRLELGLAPPERTIGLAAHDFQQAVCNTDVILSRALRTDNAPSVASRWLTRLENLTVGSGPEGKAAWTAMRERGNTYLGWARQIDAVGQIASEPRPCPVPPAYAHPKRLGVTEVEKLQRDPYSIYASRILRLKSIAPLGQPSNYAFRGIVFHDVMEAFLRRQLAEPNADPVALYRQVVGEVTERSVPWPTVAALWRARLLRQAGPFVAKELERQQVSRPVSEWLETAGRYKIDGAEHKVELRGRADRIDQCVDGKVALFDYKSGEPKKQNKELYSKQLALEAKMISLGAFKDVGPQEVATTEIIVVGNPKLDRKEDWHRGIDVIWGELLELIDAYHTGRYGYASRLDPYDTKRLGDYDHLARRGEWRDGVKLEKSKVG